jgi:hypothetical protein
MTFQQLTCWPAFVVVATVFLGSANAVAGRTPPERPIRRCPDAQPEAGSNQECFQQRATDRRRRDRPLMEVLSDISRLARIAIVPGEDFSRHRISVRCENVALEDGLRRILVAYDSFFFFGIDDAPPASVKSVWVYSRGRGRGIAPVPPQMWASATELRDRLAREDAEARAAAIEALVEREGRCSECGLTLDPGEVRARALYLDDRRRECSGGALPALGSIRGCSISRCRRWQMGQWRKSPRSIPDDPAPWFGSWPQCERLAAASRAATRAIRSQPPNRWRMDSRRQMRGGGEEACPGGQRVSKRRIV